MPPRKKPASAKAKPPAKSDSDRGPDSDATSDTTLAPAIKIKQKPAQQPKPRTRAKAKAKGVDDNRDDLEEQEASNYPTRSEGTASNKPKSSKKVAKNTSAESPVPELVVEPSPSPRKRDSRETTPLVNASPKRARLDLENDKASVEASLDNIREKYESISKLCMNLEEQCDKPQSLEELNQGSGKLIRLEKRIHELEQMNRDLENSLEITTKDHEVALATSQDKSRELEERLQAAREEWREDAEDLRDANNKSTKGFEDKVKELKEASEDFPSNLLLDRVLFLESQLAELRSNQGDTLLAGAPLTGNVHIKSHEFVVKAWVPLSLEFEQIVLRNLTSRPAEVRPEDVCDFEAVSRFMEFHKKFPDDSPNYLSGYVWREISRCVFFGESRCWGGLLGQGLAKMCTSIATCALTAGDPKHLEALSQIKFTAAKQIDRDFGANPDDIKLLADRLTGTLSVFAPPEKVKGLSDQFSKLIAHAVELQALFMESMAHFVVTFDSTLSGSVVFDPHRMRNVGYGESSNLAVCVAISPTLEKIGHVVGGGPDIRTLLSKADVIAM